MSLHATLSRVKRKCSECPQVSNSLGMGTHHKHSGHTGKEEV